MDAITKTGTFFQEREVVCLKVTQNLSELSPIGRLPAELVILLAQRLLDITKPADVPKALVGMSSVCVRFRCVLANEPVLWSSVVLDGRWTKPVRDLFITRAASHPLMATVETAWDDSYVSDLRDAAGLLPRMAGLSASLISGRGPMNFVAMLQSADMPLLETLDLVAYVSATVSASLLTPTSCVRLQSLCLQQVQISIIPHLPSLRCLRLFHTDCPFQQVENLILRTPGLTSLVLVNAMRRDVDDETVSADFEEGHHPGLTYHTSVLDTLTIRDTLVHSAKVINMLPVPTRVFSVDIPMDHLQASPTWSSGVGPIGLIVFRLVQFWATTTNDEHSFPAGEVVWEHVHEGLFQQNIRFESRANEGVPSLRYSSSCKISYPDPILDYVAVLKVHTRRRGISHSNDLAVDGLQLSCFPNVERLIISVSSDDIYIENDRHRMEILEAWILERHRTGRPLCSIQFRTCPNALLDLFGRLRDRRLAASVTWQDGDSDSTMPGILDGSSSEQSLEGSDEE
jgi:hypothetical protein